MEEIKELAQNILAALNGKQLIVTSSTQTHVVKAVNVDETMGIRGLSSYIQARASKYLQDHELQNTTVVIDGNNLACATYNDCPRINPCFGGDYNVYYNYVKGRNHLLCECSPKIIVCFYFTEIFQQLKRCKVRPLVIFDGGLDIGNRKHRQRILRAKAKVIASVKVKPSNQHRMRVLPVFFKTVFLNLLREMKIEVIQCQYEADQEIGALARGLNCPVISNDSDFYVVNVILIPLSSLDFGGAYKNSKGPAIKCKIFIMEQFLARSVKTKESKKTCRKKMSKLCIISQHWLQ